MTIYIDILFLENFILNFIILYAVGIISKSKIKFWKIGIGATLGAIYAIIYYFLRSKIYLNLIAKIILSVVMIYISFETKNFKELFKLLVFFYLTSFVFGGAAFSVIYMVNLGRISIKNGIFIGDYTLKTIFIGTVIAFIVIIVSFKFIKSKISKNDLLYDVIIKLNKKDLKTKAMVDTGNLLKEPITNIPVVVVEHTILYEAIPKEILDNIENILGGDFKNISEEIKNEYMSKLKVIPFTSLGKQNGMLLGLKADELQILEDDTVKKVDKVIIGIYNRNLSKKNEYKALLGIDII